MLFLDGIFPSVIPLNLSIPTEMGYIQPLVENKNSAKLQNCVILTSKVENCLFFCINLNVSGNFKCLLEDLRH